jgi:hypothetical protein
MQLRSWAEHVRKCARASDDGLERQRLGALADTIAAEGRMQEQAQARRAERLAVLTQS